jgi:hypothetical protein
MAARLPSEFGPQGIRLEVSIRPVLRPPREVRLRQLLAANIYSRVDLADLQAGIDRMGIPGAATASPW